jgi:ribosomal protein S18 acetylase RimI-like enzyme
MNTQFRQYADTDHDQVFALHNLALTLIGAHAGNGPWDDDLHHIEEVYLQNRGEFMVATIGDQVVGMGGLKKIDRASALITRMRVHPEFQRRGIGRALLEKLEQRARELKFLVLKLDTTVQQVAAQNLYRKNGFIQTDQKQQGQFEVLFFEKQLQADPRLY